MDVSSPGVAAEAPVPVEPGATRYDFEIDPTDDSSQSRVIRAVGSGKTVLEIGAATGATTRVLRANGCVVTAVEIDTEAAARASAWADRLIVADLEAQSLRDVVAPVTAFEVVIAADVLEHLRAPGAVLREMASLTAEGGRCIVSVPNVAHGSLRLALLDGRWEYTEIGLLDRTHVHMFTRASIEQLFDQAGLDVTDVQRVEKALDDTEVEFDTSLLDTDAGRRVLADPDATTYQFVVVGTPRTPAPATQVVRRVERSVVEEQGELLRDLRSRLHAAEQDVQTHRATVAQQADRIAQLELEARQRDAQVHALAQEVLDTRTSLEEILRSRAYRVGMLARRAYRALPGRRLS